MRKAGIDSSQCAIATEYHHGFVQSDADRLAGQGHTQRLNQLADLQLLSRRKVFEGRFERRGFERLERCQDESERVYRRETFGTPQGFGELFFVVLQLIVGQEDIINQVLLTLFVGGNSLIVGVPGLAKTLLIHTISKVVDLKFSRIQFTPDLMPSDITGTDIIQEDAATGRRSMVFSPGPIFCNILLADEINRTPPKTQSALLEAMQEHRVTIQGRTYKLEEPFYVFATQNPIELEGTYPLPEAQLDRFMFHIVIEHPPEDEEFLVVKTTTAILEPQFEIGRAHV